VTVREELLVAFAEEVMGPRKADPRETLPQDQDPQYDYIVGILAPKDAAAVEPDVLEAQAGSRIPEEADKPGYRGWSDEEDDGAEGPQAVGPGEVPTALNAKGQPASIGISVVVRSSDERPRVSICCTWARYHVHGETWERRPMSFVELDVEPEDGREWRPRADPSVRLLMRTNRLKDGALRLSLFLVNESKVPADRLGKRPPTPTQVFQPQIRIVAEGETRLSPLDPRNVSADDATLELLYSARKTFARGHLCSATWGSVDPQRPFRDAPAIASVPFGWPDGEVLPEEIRTRFQPREPDGSDSERSARTEFIPTYSIEAPEIVWNEEYGRPPELRAAELAEAFDPEVLRDSLMPMAEGYARWITEREGEAARITAYGDAANRQLAALNDALYRIRAGIDVLLQDEDARLAFTFMNKAMDLQAGWAGRKRPDGSPGLVWRPFQLGFILHALTGVVREGEERDTLDLLWFPTGGGKTEAYLGLTAFTLAFRRRQALRRKAPDGGAGVGVISRYTLRLLTIQQFRRALSAITAADYLRVKQMGHSGIGWRPEGYKPKETYLWGGQRFSIGLWVGGAVTPNQLEGFEFYNEDGDRVVVKGAIDVLRGQHSESEPAQVLNCPACANVLAVPNTGLEKGARIILHLLANIPSGSTVDASKFPTGGRTVLLNVATRPIGGDLHVLSVECEMTDTVRPADIDQLVDAAIKKATASKGALLCARASRSGYFLTTPRGSRKPKAFEIICVNPKCELTKAHWFDLVPSNGANASGGTAFTEAPIPPEFKGAAGKMRGMPISGFVVDDQVYARCPSMLIATVDKFARLAYEPRAGSIFGNVDHYHEKYGYYRAGAPPDYSQPGPHPSKTGFVPCGRFDPPSLIIQDELHLIEGPLGSMVGLYETALDLLATRPGTAGKRVRPKYVASTATIRAAAPQVKALFDRNVAQFPPSGLASDDSFFARTEEIHQRDERKAGRLYVGFAAPGKGSQTPVIRAWSALLQRAGELRPTTASADLDPYWTLVGYFNAIKELARATGLCRIDIPQWINALSDRTGNAARDLETTGQMELSSRAESHVLPSLLSKLATELPDPAVDIVLATSMFGTGVDVDRLGLMFLHSQPKTTSTYIQSTGRIGRRKAGMVLTFLGAGRPRDLAHYEFFVGFHRAIHKGVEPVTVAPFSPRARERALGPLSVVLLRNARQINGTPVPTTWIHEQRAGKGTYVTAAFDMAAKRHDPEVLAIIAAMEARAQAQPPGRLPEKDVVKHETGNELDKWQKLAQTTPRPDGLLYSESTYARRAQRRVVLGDPAHAMQNLDCAFENAPNSLREVEKTVRVDVRTS